MQFQMSTHCHRFSVRDLYGTLGTATGIIRVTCLLGPEVDLHTQTLLQV